MIDVQEAKKFLSALSSHDDGTIFSFQTLYDVKPEHDDERRAAEEKRLTRTIHGRFEDKVDELIEMNKRGAGIFVCVNRTNGMGLRGKDVDRIRSFFVDDDTDHLQPEQMPIPPSIVVRSKRGNHFYWLTANGTARDMFGPAQKALAAKCETDHTIFNLNRVMRMPGFLHNKGEPYKVSLEHVDEGKAYELEDVANAFGIELEEYTFTPRTNVDSDTVAAIPMERRMQRARGMLHAIGPAVRSSGDGHSKTMSACRVGNDFAIEDFTFLGLLQEWGASCDPPWDPAQLETFYFSTLPSIDGERFKWGAKLLDDNYASKPRQSRPQGVSPAAAYRDHSIPWSGAEPYEAQTPTPSHSYEMPDAPVRRVEGVLPPEPPVQQLRATAQKRIIGRSDGIKTADALPQDLLVRKSERRPPSQNNEHRMGADIESCDDDVNFGDAQRRPREMAYHLRREYKFRRDDSRCVYIYSHSFWKETSREFIEKLTLQYTTFQDIKMKTIKEAASLALTQNHIPRIRWNLVDMTEIPLKNGVLDFQTGHLRDHRPEDYLDRLIPIDYTPGATCELWEDCLDQWLPDMKEEREALQLFFGYILMPHAHYKKAVILFGPPDTGKSQVCAIATALVGGLDAVCSITPDDMDDPRKLAPIKGKALNCVPDLKKNTVLADGGFKQLVSTGDAIQIDQKFTRSELYTPTAKHLFATNNLPTIRDVTDAVFRRLMILGFNARVPKEAQDTKLEEKLKKELPGILNWAIEGARKLYEGGGRWPKIRSSDDLVQEYKRSQNSLYFYIKESGEVIEDPNGKIKTEKLRVQMNQFNGGKSEYGRRGFSKLIDGLADDMPDLRKEKKSGSSFVFGLKWTSGQEDLALDE
jgi:P4 family phage/plasmid primase-like protien